MELQSNVKLQIPKSTTKGTLKWTWGTTRNVYRSFENAKTYVRALELDSVHSFREFAKMYVKGGPLSNYRLMPADIPVIPEHIYIKPYGDDTPFDWDDFLGTKKSGRKGKKVRLTADGNWYLPYEEWKKKVIRAKVVSIRQYRLWRLSDEQKHHLPKDPEQTYQQQWEGWTSVLCNDIYIKYDRSRVLMPYNQAIKYVHTLGLKSMNQYRDWWLANPVRNLPLTPDIAYQRDWTGWEKYLGSKLEYRLSVAQLNVDCFVFTKLKLGQDLYRIYIDERGSAHAIDNLIDGDQLIELFKYQRTQHQQIMNIVRQLCLASSYGQTIVHCSNPTRLIHSLSMLMEPVRWKEVRAVKYEQSVLTEQHQQFCRRLMIPGRDPIYDQRPIHVDPVEFPEYEHYGVF